MPEHAPDKRTHHSLGDQAIKVRRLVERIVTAKPGSTPQNPRPAPSPSTMLDGVPWDMTTVAVLTVEAADLMLAMTALSAELESCEFGEEERSRVPWRNVPTFVVDEVPRPCL